LLAPSQLMTIVITIISGLMLSYYLGWPPVFGFSIGLLLLIYIVYKKGFTFRWIWSAMRNGVFHTKEVLWILFLIGMLIPIWTASGVIPYMIEKGVALLIPSYFLLSSFIFACILSLLLGTAVGTLSTIGIPLLGIGALMDIPLFLVAGALISGAFVGDRTSPYSSARLLVAASTDISIKQQGRALLPTTCFGVIICVCFYGLMDIFNEWGTTSGDKYEMFSAVFSFHDVLLLPPVVLVIGILFRIRMKYCFLISIALAGVLGAWLHNFKPANFFLYIWDGYHSAELPVLSNTSLSNMISIMVLLIAAGAFNGLLEKTKMLQPYIQKMLGDTDSLLQATVRVVIFGFLLVLVACSQTLPVMMSGRNVLPIWKRRFPQEELSRIISDSSLLLAAIIPWNMLALLCGAILEVKAIHYAPFAIFLWLMPVLTVLYSALKKPIKNTPFYSKQHRMDNFAKRG
jgi:NhaC family Na+:H+ antiporter